MTNMAQIGYNIRQYRYANNMGNDMAIRPIRTEGDYKEALRQIETLMNAEANTPEGDMLEVLATLVEDYERKAYPVELPDPVAAIEFYMEQNGLAPKDLQDIIGKRNRVYEVLNRKRPLTLRMIRNLHEKLGIPADVLIRPQIIPAVNS